MPHQTIEKAYQHIEARVPYRPEVAVITGSGLGGFADKFPADAVVSYGEIPGFPVSTVDGHKGRFVFARVLGVPVVFMQGRVHYYEGYSMQEVVMPVRLMRLMGAEKLLLTNAAGGINPDFRAGTFMAICDHILLASNPLIGENLSAFGVRFPDMSGVYDKKLLPALDAAAADAGISLPHGVYLQVTGPSFETPAEIRAFGRWGADAVGMSTACEAVAARHAGLRVSGISCISNAAAGLGANPLSHEEVNQTTTRVRDKAERLLERAVYHIAKS